ncbi:MAG: OmpA family protein [Planctomycetota bacterium]
MQFRSIKMLVSLVALTLLGSCTSRYQDLLRDRDAEIRNLNGSLASMRAQKDDLERQLASERTAPALSEPKNAGFENDTKGLQDELGPDVTVDYRKGRLSLGVDDTVTFDSGSDKLKSTASRVLKSIVTVLKRDYDDCKIYVEGHTDSDPIKKSNYLDNRELSAKRANAVARFLIEQGMSERNIVIVGFGQFDPRDTKSKERNRRVEIVPARQ